MASDKNDTQNSGEVLAKLKTLAGQAGKNLHTRLKLCTALLADHQYVLATWGDDSKALEVIEADCFGDLCGARSLSELLAMYRLFPTEAKWAECKWNLTRLLAEWDETRKQQRREDRGPRKTEPTKAQLLEEIETLKRDNAVLKAQNDELRRFIDRGLGKVAV